MIEFEKFTLENGLKVIVHEDPDTEIAAINILYDVGSRDENQDKTGFAHLFEHLMFGGSKNVPSYDEPLQRVGGENNAFTSPDITNYYLSLPSNNLETGFWLESDRMLALSFDPKVLEVQRNVVIEEFKQRYLNQPYGDIWLKLRPLCYHEHSYKWPTIGEKIEHIEDATLDDVKDFFYKFYAPNNAILVVSGKVKTEEVRSLSKKWFGPIPRRDTPERSLKPEPQQNSKRFLEVEADVPLSALYKTYHMSGRTSPDFHSEDLISDILGRGKSSRLYQSLVKDKKIFNSLSAYITGSIDPGLLVISGKVNPEFTLEESEAEVDKIAQALTKAPVSADEIEKVKNQAESTIIFSEIGALNKAMNLAFFELLGDASLINKESEEIQKITPEDVLESAKRILRQENSSTLYYRAKSKSQ